MRVGIQIAILIVCISEVRLCGVSPERYELGLALTAAVNNRDAVALLKFTEQSLETKGRIPSRDFSMLMVSASLSWDRLANTEKAALSNASYFRHLAREVLIVSELDVAARQYQRVEWHPELYSSVFDERTFTTARQEESDLRLQLWRKIEDRLSTLLANGRPEQTASSNDYTPEGRARYLAETEALNYWADLKREGPYFARTTVTALANSYQVNPIDFDELRGLVEHHMSESRVTNAWERIVAELPEQFRAQAAAAYAKPYEAKPRKSLLPPIVPPPRPEPGLPAVARPSKVLEGMRQQQAAQAAQAAAAAKPAHAESPGGMVAATGGKPAWAWALLGLAVAAVATVWWRTR